MSVFQNVNNDGTLRAVSTWWPTLCMAQGHLLAGTDSGWHLGTGCAFWKGLFSTSTMALCWLTSAPTIVGVANFYSMSFFMFSKCSFMSTANFVLTF